MGSTQDIKEGNTKQSKDEAARTRNWIVIGSLIIAIAIFVMFMGLSAADENGEVITSIQSVRLGDASIEKFNVPEMIAEKAIPKVSHQAI